jgi:hypothetical protein
MPFTPDTATGRPRGAENKETKQLREAIKAITEGSVIDFQTTMNEVRESNPTKFLELYIKLLEYTMPKLRSVEANLELGDSTVEKIVVNVINNGQRVSNTSNNSIPEELGS